MPFTMTMPKLSPTMESGTINKWLKKVGDKVNAGDALIEVSTDKASVEHSALDEGFLRAILVQEGQEATVNAPIAIFTEEANESIEGYAPEGEAPKAAVQEKPKEQPVQKEIPAAKPEGRIVASPLAKKLAQTKGIDLSKLQGSGPRGRIVAADLDKAPAARGAPTVPSGTFEEIQLTPIRKIISQRLQEAKSTIPHFYVQQVIDASPLVNFREQLSNLDVKVSYNDCVMKACALALREHPAVNAGFNPSKQTIVLYKTIDVSVAVNVESGLITPIIPHTDHKSLSEISSEVRALAKKAKEGKLAPHEFQGGSFTVSNMGMYGVTSFQAILNPPQAAILAVAGIQDTPVVKHGAVVPGKTMSLTLSVDHRVVDGVAAAEFIKTVQKLLENPASLLLN